ncbi:MAG: hypothetical protein DMG14_00700 [Acidobacteria bacterium]|nr:MAG: hypothetical protein DMG14_00700 [Acidobacteriota bacterium]
MKRFITFAFTLSFALYLSSVATYAQVRNGRGPVVSSGAERQGHAPDINHGQEHGKDAVHDADHSTKESKQAHRDAKLENRIEHDPELKARLTSMLPAGMDLKTAASGFKNKGQFIAALHVCKNLDIPFADLKAKMIGPPTESLGDAIHVLKPTLSQPEVKKEAEKAETEAKETEKPKPVS